LKWHTGKHGKKAVSTAIPAREAILSGEAFQITKTVIPF